jgi:hypothetical protein
VTGKHKNGLKVATTKNVTSGAGGRLARRHQHRSPQNIAALFSAGRPPFCARYLGWVDFLFVYRPRSLLPSGYLAWYSVTARSIVTKCAPPSRRFLMSFSSMMSRCPRPMT